MEKKDTSDYGNITDERFLDVIVNFKLHNLTGEFPTVRDHDNVFYHYVLIILSIIRMTFQVTSHYLQLIQSVCQCMWNIREKKLLLI